MTFQTYPVVRIKWKDACHIGGTGWSDDVHFEPPLLAAEASGYLIPVDENKYGEECVALASALVFEESGSPNFCPSFIIPKGMIISVEELG